ncbi:deoxycytidylate deaminase [Paramaledivibacter caminithermalis]|jgi:dCMP deaminase|uniref:dCMP deaminase n=1 Tax=Paramaledivibacter caminithermalis (strain DSM 15212 / CIP 107654 / DViRD3) TaxID=1121301 RepID=A0A1M6L2S9_PARC5|nr:deaminase [Paramaledivibacter caminithermalis]SHJ65452.1 dCMP deaminase [Paramaledivibacter caminithermalis DSM 15212]
MKRRNKHNYYLDIAESVLERGTCLRRNYGAVIVKNDEIISTGYSGAPRGRENCCDIGYCVRQKLNIPRGQNYEKCRSVHAEANSIISASRRDMIDATLYLVGKEMENGALVKHANSCTMCKRLIINSGIEKVIIRDTNEEFRIVYVQDWIDNDDSLTESMGY